MSLKQLVVTLTLLQLLWRWSEEMTIELPELSQISMAQAFNQSLDFLSSNAIKCKINSTPSSCPQSAAPFKGDYSRWYPPPPPLPPRLLECAPSFKTDCNVTSSGGDGGETGKIVSPDLDLSLGILVGIVSIFGVLIFSSIIGFLLKRKNRARIAPRVCCDTTLAESPSVRVSSSNVRASSGIASAASSSAPASLTGNRVRALAPPSPRIKAKVTSIVAMARSKCVDSDGSWNCWIQQSRESKNNDTKYYNHASEMREY